MSIFNHRDSRTFLTSHIAGLPRKGRGEASRLAQHLGISTTLVSQILRGEKSFTSEQAQRVANFLGFTGLEEEYFLFLVQFERAGSSELKKFWRAKLENIKAQALKLENRVRAEKVLSEQERAVFYSTPLYSAIRLFTSIGKSGKSLVEVADYFEIPRARTAEMLKFLVETGLCAMNGERYFLGAQTTHLEHGSPHLLKHHSNWRVRAIHKSESLPEDELMYTAPVSLSHADFADLREKMVQFIKSFVRQVEASPAEEIACFNMDFFRIKK